MFEQAVDAVVSGDLATLRDLLRADPTLVQQRSPREHAATLLIYTAANGVENERQRTPPNIVEITAALLDAGAEVDAEANLYGGGCTTLELAATSCHPEAAGVQDALLELLLDRGAQLRPGIVVSCLANGRKRAAAFLAEHGAALDLEGAAGVGRLDLVDQLFATATDQQRRDALLWACQFEREAVVDRLLARGVTAAGTGHRGITALHWAAYAGNANIVRTLLAHGAPIDAVEPGYDGTPLDWAHHARDTEHRTGDHDGVIAQLVAAGAVRP
jgi:ankyrin repeat protein